MWTLIVKCNDKIIVDTKKNADIFFLNISNADISVNLK